MATLQDLVDTLHVAADAAEELGFKGYATQLRHHVEQLGRGVAPRFEGIWFDVKYNPAFADARYDPWPSLDDRLRETREARDDDEGEEIDVEAERAAFLKEHGCTPGEWLTRHWSTGGLPGDARILALAYHAMLLERAVEVKDLRPSEQPMGDADDEAPVRDGEPVQGVPAAEGADRGVPRRRAVMRGHV